jgi:hypothetical protein
MRFSQKWNYSRLNRRGVRPVWLAKSAIPNC